MMYFPKTSIASAASYVAQYANVEVTYNETDILVISDSSAAINEFEVRLAAHSTPWDGEECNGAVLLDTLVNIHGVRTEFRPRRTTDEWQARYSIVAQS